MEKVHLELNKHGITDWEELNTIREQNGIGVYAINCSRGNFVLKIFFDKTFKREIEYYKLLSKLEIKTIDVINYSEDSILLENINFSDKYRLGKEEDLKSKKVSEALGTWYNSLHNKGSEYLRQNNDIKLYSEYSEITETSIEKLLLFAEHDSTTLSSKILKVLSYANEYLKNNRTLTYNDFYYVNLIVSKDESEAFMFDYNYLGEGLRCSDYNNVTHWFDQEQKELFLKNYGEINPIEFEISSILGTVFDLIHASRCESIPDWAKDPLQELKSGSVEKSFDLFIKNNFL